MTKGTMIENLNLSEKEFYILKKALKRFLDQKPPQADAFVAENLLTKIDSPKDVITYITKKGS